TGLTVPRKRGSRNMKSISATAKFRRRAVKSLLLLFGLAGPLAGERALAQSFNIDIDTTVAGSSGLGVPAATFGAAAAQPGTWNSFAGAVATSINLVDLTGAPTGVTLSRDVVTGGNFNFDNTNTTGDHQLLLDD